MIQTLIQAMRKGWRRDVPQALATAEEVRNTLARERMLIDRRGGVVCLLTFEVSRANEPREYIRQLAIVLQQRLRNTDLAGFLGPRRVAVVLPDTAKLGAEKLAADIRQASGFLSSELPHSISEYGRPSDDQPVSRDTRHSGASSNGSGKHVEASVANQPAEAVFCVPVPLWKRTMDVAGACFGLMLFSPVLIVTAVLVKLTSRGPMLFVQYREGRGGRIFPMFKFRTMRVGAEQEQQRLRQFSEQDGPAFKMKNDPRLTSVGAFLRRTSIDEMPQLLNVLRGEMSLVGPRPLPHSESAQCTGWQRRRLHVNPGMTCIWQVRGRSSVSFVEWVRMDLEYVREMSLWLDLKLLFLTLPALLGQRGAH